MNKHLKITLIFLVVFTKLQVFGIEQNNNNEAFADGKKIGKGLLFCIRQKASVYLMKNMPYYKKNN